MAVLSKYDLFSAELIDFHISGFLNIPQQRPGLRYEYHESLRPLRYDVVTACSLAGKIVFRYVFTNSFGKSGLSARDKF